MDNYVTKNSIDSNILNGTISEDSFNIDARDFTGQTDFILEGNIKYIILNGIITVRYDTNKIEYKYINIDNIRLNVNDNFNIDLIEYKKNYSGAISFNTAHNIISLRLTTNNIAFMYDTHENYNYYKNNLTLFSIKIGVSDHKDYKGTSITATATVFK